MNAKALQKQLIAAVAMLLVAAIALGSSTYAWFINNSTVTAKTADVTATTADYLFISEDGSKFGTSMNLDTQNVTLTPVSTVNDNLKAATTNFYKVDESKANTWVDSKANLFMPATSADYYYDQLWLKSSTVSAPVSLDITVDASSASAHTDSAIYVAFVPTASGASTKSDAKIYQLSADKTVTGGANTNTTDATSTSGAVSTKGIKAIQTDGTVLESDRTALTVLNDAAIEGNKYSSTFKITGITFDELNATADLATKYDVYIWLEGTDPQCFNPIAQKAGNTSEVKISFAFYTGETVGTPDATITYNTTATTYNTTEYYKGSDANWYTKAGEVYTKVTDATIIAAVNAASTKTA